ncbi:hypothetical protein WEH80_07075 [Actinomycetes bacterium KLBMP 9759]
MSVSEAFGAVPRWVLALAAPLVVLGVDVVSVRTDTVGSPSAKRVESAAADRMGDTGAFPGAAQPPRRRLSRRS